MTDKLQRVTQLTAPPVIGQRYLVPTVFYPWLPQGRRERERAWPVFPNRHDDVEIFSFPQQHYHVDPRFLSDRDLRGVARYATLRTVEEIVHGAPLAYREAGGNREHPPIVWRPRYCYREPFEPHTLTRLTQPHFAGQQCASSRHSWVCPHRNYPLGSIPVAADGSITCPLHGLRIDAASGVVLPATNSSEPT